MKEKGFRSKENRNKFKELRKLRIKKTNIIINWRKRELKGNKKWKKENKV